MDFRSVYLISDDHSQRRFRHTLGVASIAEIILLAVGTTEDPVSREVDQDDDGSPNGSQLDLVEHQVTSLE